ncbi:MAG: hypothetical protein SR3Q1_04765 [Quinella sp. 3Q1]|nr:hypothetical protein [Quinella sp. 3Q1]
MTIDEKNPIPYKLQAEIFDESGQADKAEESYRKLYELTKKKSAHRSAELFGKN